jgi:hypothetical protein
MLILFHALVLLGPGVLFILMTSRAMHAVRLQVTPAEKLIGAVAAWTLPGMYLVQTLLYRLFPGAFARFESMTHEMWMPAAGLVAGIVMSWWWWHRTRNFSLGLWSIFALPGSAAVALFFEAGTHGRWYIQNEGQARVLTVAVWYVSYAVLMGGALVLWVKSARATLHAGRCIVCHHEMPEASGTCPRCGAARAGAAGERGAAGA